MSVAVTINPSDVAVAANFLEQFLSDQVPDGDFTRGTALRDLTVQAIAAVVSFLRADAAQIRLMQSLVTIEGVTGNNQTALADGVTAILSNFFVTPKSGTKSRGFVIGHSAQQVDIFIPVNTQFVYQPGLVFTVDSPDTYFVPKSELTPIINADGTVTDYEFRLPLVATAVGENYNILPNVFSSFGRFNPYVTRIESAATFSGGKGTETVSEVLARAPTAISVRNLINARSIAATIEDNFDGVESVLVIGMGDAEMRRDIVPSVAPNLKFHVGGAVDIYLRTPLFEKTFTGAVGGLFARPDGVTTVFRDPSVSFSSVQPGDIIRVTAGLPSVPAEFLVVDKGIDYLIVSEGAPFPVATDEADPVETVSYVIGNVAPKYDNVLSAVGGQPITTGITSRRVRTSGRITLPGGPVMDILDVAVINPAAGEVAFTSELDGFVHFNEQVNTTPSQSVVAPASLQFQTVVHNPPYAQSSAQWMEVIVGTDTNPARFDGSLLRVRYRSLQSFDSIDYFVRSARERVSAAYQLPRAHNPVVVKMRISYVLYSTATTLLNDTDIAKTVADYINAFDASAGSIDVSSIIQLVKNAYPTIANIVPLVAGTPILAIDYYLRLPTGDVITYATSDVVKVDPAYQVAGPEVDLYALGVTNRTLRYISTTDDISALQAVF